MELLIVPIIVNRKRTGHVQVIQDDDRGEAVGAFFFEQRDDNTFFIRSATLRRAVPILYEHSRVF